MANSENWKQSLLPASFMGVGFVVENSSGNFGRRNVAHEYPGRDGVENEDLGRKYREFSFSAYVVGDDYFNKRDSLIQIAERKNNAGLLIHPYLGRMRAKLLNVLVSENVTEGRMCRLTLTFNEDSEVKLTVIKESLKNEILEKADKTNKDTKSMVSRIYDINAKGLAGAQVAINVLDGFLKNIKDAKASLAPFGEWRRSIDVGVSRIISIVYNAQDLVNYIEYLATTGTDLSQREIIPSVRITRELRRSLLQENNTLSDELYRDFTSSAEPEDWNASPENLQKISNLMMHTSSSISMLPDIDFESIEEAEEQRDIFYLYLNFIASLNGLDEEMYVNIYDLKSLVELQIEEILPTLGRARLYSVNDEGKPSLTIAYENYNNLGDEIKLLNMNKDVEINPFFISGDLAVVR